MLRIPFYDLQWLRDEFLVYLDEWEKSVNDRPGFSKEEKNLMLLSPATRLGIKMTGNYSTNFAICMPS